MSVEPGKHDDGERSVLETFAEAAFDNAPVGLALTELDKGGTRRIRVANRAFAGFLGTTPAALESASMNELTHPDDLHFDAAGSGSDGSSDIDMRRNRYLNADGRYVWAEQSSRVLQASGDSTVAVACVLDVDARVRLEHARADMTSQLERALAERTEELRSTECELREAVLALREQHARLELLLDASKAGIGVWDIPAGSVELSDSWYQLLGYEPGEIDIDNEGIRRFVHPDDRADLERFLWQAFDTRDRKLEHTFRVHHKDGSWRWYRHRIVVTERDADGQPLQMLGVDIDVTEQRRLEEQLLHAANMQSLGAFAGGLAHDFNNILAIIQGHIEALGRAEKTKGDASSPAARIAAIERAVSRASALVNEVTLLNRPAAAKATTIDLGSAILEFETTLEHLLGEDVALDIRIPTEPVVVRIDKGRFEAALLSLASNAREAMPTGGTVSVTLISEQSPAIGRRSDTDHHRGAAVARLEVTDDGVGMNADTLSSIFEPFFTTKPPGVRAGLGLATTFVTVTEANGTITAESEPGVGTTVRIILPTVSAPRVAPVAREPRTGGKAILVVEDEAELLELTTDLLRAEGHRVYSALDGPEALETLESHGDIALLLTDAVMPGMNGPELASIVQRRWPSIKIIYVSGYAAASVATARIDPRDMLTKPVSHEALTTAVAEAVGRP